jgi:hypothetical protein
MTDSIATRLAAALGPSYQVASLLGRGGMGAVYRASDRRLRRDVAVKVLPPELGYSEALRSRFVREAQMAAQLSHPNIVPIYDVGERDDLVWFVMAFIDGESVRAKVEREGPVPISVVRRVLQEVAQALAYAHARGVIHRDIKPDNIMMDRGSGRAVVTDFGIAKALTGADTDLTQPGEVIGTARYMAPEQALGEGTVDQRADMYALGLVAYFMLGGTHAIQGASLPAVIAEHIKGSGVDLARIGRRLPLPLVTALQRCLSPKPEERFPRMEEFVEALRELGGELPDVPAPVRLLLRETERAFVVGALGAGALGLVGVENTPLGLILLLAGGVVGQWTLAIEKAARRGVTWSAIRRALYVERARRVDEIQEVGQSNAMGISSMVATFGLILGGMFVAGQAGFALSTPLNVALFMAGTFGGVLATNVFGLPKVAQPRLTARLGNLLVAGLIVIVVALLTGFLVGFRGAIEGASVAAGVATAVVMGGVLGAGAVTLYRLAKKLERSWGARRAAEFAHAEWRLPSWLDVLGSWLFGRFVRDGWRIRLERDRPLAFAAVELGLSAAHQVERRIHALAGGITGTGAGAAWEAGHLARDLVAECRRAEHQLKPLLAKVARLSEGVLVSRTIAAGGSVESELDQAERSVDALRTHALECGEMLNALAVGLEAVSQGQDAKQLEAALQQARQLSSAVRRGMLMAKPT